MDAIRTKSGRISEGNAESVRRAEIMTETAKEARRRVFGISEKDSGSQEAGSVLGRLYLDGALGLVMKQQGTSWLRKEAGDRYAMDMARYYMLTGIPHPSPRAQNVLAVRGYDGDEAESRAQAARKASNRMMALEMCLGAADTQGRPVTSSIKTVCIMDEETARGWHPSQIQHLRRGLDALVKFYGLDGQ
jgi:hypothetical protein